ncbi:MAG: hypothetical protein IKV03_06015 [Alphaproteobacteria bacterium]|nr:hypothetical protein [Alphaproteobacteria bacterium]
MKQISLSFLIAVFLVFNTSSLKATENEKPSFSYQIQPTTFSYDSIKEILNNLATQKSQSDDILLNVLLAVPVEKRQYVYPALHENKGMPKKILSHPEIIPFKGTRPTELPVYLKDYAKEYLAYLPSAYYIHLDPDFWQETSNDQSISPVSIFSKTNNDLKMIPHKGEFFTFPSIRSLYHLSPETEKSYKKTDLKEKDIKQLFSTISALEEYVNNQENPRKFKLSLIQMMMRNNDLDNDLSWPFASLVERLKKLKSKQEIEELFQKQGWLNSSDFTNKADRILKAYRVNYLSLPQAIQLNKIRGYPASAPTTEVLENLKTYAKMHDATPGDVYFVKPYLQDIRSQLKPDFILMLGTPIFME